MKYHIALTKINADRISRELNQEKVHRSDLLLLAKYLNASFIKQQDYPIKPLDRVRAKFSGTPANWAFARAIADQLGEDDLVFCPGEEIGIPLATVCRSKKVRPRIVVWLHRITGLRTRVALKLFDLAHAADLFVVTNLTNKEFLETYLGLPGKQILFLRHFVDDRFFTPGTGKLQSRSLIASVGLEFRDYKLLASATADLDLDVKIAGFSQFQSRTAEYLPKVMPANMSNKKYSWSELIDLYRSADLVVICLKENTTAAGVTVLLEAMCCQKPIICTHTQGLKEYLQDEKAVITVESGNVRELRNAIIYLLEHPEEARQMGEYALQLVRERHNLDTQVKVLGDFIQTIEHLKVASNAPNKK